jgi:hypothetical protein
MKKPSPEWSNQVQILSIPERAKIKAVKTGLSEKISKSFLIQRPELSLRNLTAQNGQQA